jgi:hypothetical protein
MKKRVFFLLLSFFFPLIFCFLFYPFFKYVIGNHERYCIHKLIQKRPPSDFLKTPYLAQLLHLSCEKKTSLSQFDFKKAEKELISSFVIKRATIKKIKPDTLYIDYTMRHPIAYLADMSNTAIDEEGFLFPFAPFYTPKYLPEIYFGTPFQENIWGTQIEAEKMTIVKEILTKFPNQCLSWMDLSKLSAPSLGQREIVIEIENHLLRLSTLEFKKEIYRYFLLKNDCLKKLKNRCIIDLRLPEVAYIKRESL